LILALGSSLVACETSTIEPIPTSTPRPRDITVSGIGKVYLTPDIATISIGVHTEDESATRSVENINIRAKEISDVLMEMGVEAKDIQVSNFNIFPEERFDENGNRVNTIYVVDNTVIVTVRNLENLGGILGSVVEAGANSIFGIQFDVAEKTQAITAARRLAVENAQDKAEELARAADVTLGQIQSINELGGVPVPVFESQEDGEFEALADQLPVNLGQLSLTVEVLVTYNIR
jgi:hypothetical protein